ncbi:10515_t:CDS:2, partial [Cetraspora pellucida]
NGEGSVKEDNEIGLHTHTVPYSRQNNINDNISTYDESLTSNIIKRPNILSSGYDNLSVSSLAVNHEQYNEQSYVLASRRILQTQQSNYHTSNYHTLTEGSSYQMQSKKQETNREIIKF